MFRTILKISLRNFLMHLKAIFALIVGLSVPSMLLVGGLSLNDTVGSWIKRSFEKNFGKADAYAENPKSNVFFRVPLDQQVTASIKDFQGVLGVLPVFETMVRVEYSGKMVDCLAVGVMPKDLADFVASEIDLPERGAIVSKDLAQSLKVKESEKISVNTPKGTVELTVVKIGEEGFLNFRGDHLQYSGTIFVNLKDLEPSFGFPTKLYLHLAGTAEEHEQITSQLKDALKLSVVPMKSRLLNSPANKALGYLTIAFSGFSLIASLILVYIFTQSFLEERKTTTVTLRTIGFNAMNIFLILLIEGFFYLAIASLLGGVLGLFVGEFLLKRLLMVSNVFSDGAFFSVPELSLQISPLTLVLGIFGGLAVPMMILISRTWKITHRPPAQLLRDEQADRSVFGLKRWHIGVLILSVASFLFIFYSKFWLALLLLAVIGLLLVLPSVYLSLVLGVFLIFLVWFIKPGDNLSAWDILQRAGTFFVAGWLIFFSILNPIRSLFSKYLSKSSVSAFIALSYVERRRRNTLVISSMFSLLLFVMVLVMCIPYNMQKFVREKLQTGLFGYDFMVIYNPLKLVFVKGELEVAEGLKSPARVYVGQMNDDVIAFVDSAFLQNAIVPIETSTDWRNQLLEAEAVVVGHFGEGFQSREVDGKVKSLFGFGDLEEVTLRVVDSFDMRQLMVPVKYVASINSVPRRVRLIPVLLGKVDFEKVAQVKEFYSRRFDFPIYITEELKRLFSGIDLLIQTAVMLLYFGLISGFSGIAFHTLRSIVLRKRLSGVLMAIGMSNKEIGVAFVLENIVIASLGMIVGIFAGLLASKDVIELILTLFGSGKFFLPLWQLVGLIAAVYAIVVVVVVLPVILKQKAIARALVTEE
ncbi:MAG: FtsX-like permease family protein [Pseudothermotoga sp.]